MGSTKAFAKASSAKSWKEIGAKKQTKLNAEDAAKQKMRAKLAQEKEAAERFRKRAALKEAKLWMEIEAKKEAKLKAQLAAEQKAKKKAEEEAAKQIQKEQKLWAEVQAEREKRRKPLSKFKRSRSYGLRCKPKER